MKHKCDALNFIVGQNVCVCREFKEKDSYHLYMLQDLQYYDIWYMLNEMKMLGEIKLVLDKNTYLIFHYYYNLL